MRHTVSVLVENRFGVLARISGLLSGRGFNIETLNVGPTHNPELSRITAVILGDESALDQCLKQLHRLINVIEITDFNRVEGVARELVLLKIEAPKETRGELIQVCELFRAKIIDVTLTTIVVEVTGNDGKIKAFLNLMSNYTILEMARTGAVALPRGIQPGS
jgi:acetolactate synthase-1/3 small subunit